MPAVSKSQQRFMGMVHAAQKGEKPASGKVAKAAKSMTKKDAHEFAATKHKGLPDKVEETFERKLQAAFFENYQESGTEVIRAHLPFKGRPEAIIKFRWEGREESTPHWPGNPGHIEVLDIYLPTSGKHQKLTGRLVNIAQELALEYLNNMEESEWTDDQDVDPELGQEPESAYEYRWGP